MTLAGGVASAGMAAVASRGQWEQGPTEMTNWLVFGAAVELGATLWALVARVSGLQEYHSLAQRLSARLSKR